MKILSKASIKLSLIDDYLQIAKIKHFSETCKNANLADANILCLADNLYNICTLLTKTYDQVFLRLGMLDESLLLIKQQINTYNLTNFAKNDYNTIDVYEKMVKNLQKTKKINENLYKKLQNLHFSVIEIQFLRSQSMLKSSTNA